MVQKETTKKKVVTLFPHSLSSYYVSFLLTHCISVESLLFFLIPLIYSIHTFSWDVCVGRASSTNINYDDQYSCQLIWIWEETLLTTQQRGKKLRGNYCFPPLNTLWIITVIHSAYLFFFHVFFFIFHFFFQLSLFSFFSFIFYFFSTKWCGKITVSPHPNALWIITVIHCAFLSLFFQTFPFPFFRFFCLFFFQLPFFFIFFLFFP